MDANVAVEFRANEDGNIEAICGDAHIASIEPGNFDSRSGSFDSNAVGFTISYGRGFEKSAWRPTLAAAKSWVERKVDDLRDY